MTAWDNLRLWYEKATLKKELEQGVLATLGIQEFIKMPVHRMSGGMNRLLQESTILFFQEVYSEEEAYEAVRKKEADVAWIFPAKMQEKIKIFVEKNGRSEKLIRIIAREDNIALQLAREKLYGALYTSFSYVVYEHYMEHNVIQEGKDKVIFTYIHLLL